MEPVNSDEAEPHERLVDHLVGADENAWRNPKPERPRGCKRPVTNIMEPKSARQSDRHPCVDGLLPSSRVKAPFPALMTRELSCRLTPG
jgi:hypothetical protein